MKKTFDEKIAWIIKQHEDTNHMYDKYLPYEFHLRMALQVSKEFLHLIPNRVCEDGVQFHEHIKVAVMGHDLIEDTRVSYNDVKKALGETAADIIFALTNEKGKVRSERANAKYYSGIRAVEGAIFGKLCDRIANVRYGKITGNDKAEMYNRENPKFGEALGFIKGNEDTVGHSLYTMFAYLSNLFLEK